MYMCIVSNLAFRCAPVAVNQVAYGGAFMRFTPETIHEFPPHIEVPRDPPKWKVYNFSELDFTQQEKPIPQEQMKAHEMKFGKDFEKKKFVVHNEGTESERIIELKDGSMREFVTATRFPDEPAKHFEHVARFDLWGRWKWANDILYGKDRDTKNFPIPESAKDIQKPPCRHHLFPVQYFDALYDRLGVTGMGKQLVDLYSYYWHRAVLSKYFIVLSDIGPTEF